MRDLTANYVVLAGLLMFVGRLQVFPSLGDAFLAGLLASLTVAVALLGYDTVVQRLARTQALAEHDAESTTSVPSEPLPHQRPDA